MDVVHVHHLMAVRCPPNRFARHRACSRVHRSPAHLHATRTDTAGIVWHSRQAELLDLAEPRQICMLYGDRTPALPGHYPLAGTASSTSSKDADEA